MPEDAETRKDIAVIKNDMQYVRSFIEEDRAKMAEHIRTSEAYRKKVDAIIGVEDKLKDHETTDRWMFGTIIIIVLAIFGLVTKLAFFQPKAQAAQPAARIQVQADEGD